MGKKGKLEPTKVLACWDAVQKILVELRPIDLRSALNIATHFGIYAYNAYFLECALSLRAPLLTLDRRMKRIALKLSIMVLEQPWKNIRIHKRDKGFQKSLIRPVRRT